MGPVYWHDDELYEGFFIPWEPIEKSIVPSDLPSGDNRLFSSPEFCHRVLFVLGLHGLDRAISMAHFLDDSLFNWLANPFCGRYGNRSRRTERVLSRRGADVGRYPAILVLVHAHRLPRADCPQGVARMVDAEPDVSHHPGIPSDFPL